MSISPAQFSEVNSHCVAGDIHFLGRQRCKMKDFRPMGGIIGRMSIAIVQNFSCHYGQQMAK